MSDRHDRLCPGTRICCPHCGKPVPHLDMRNGDSFFLCRACKSHAYLVCTDRLCSVWELTAEERHRFDDGHHSPDQIMQHLGLRWIIPPQSRAA